MTPGEADGLEIWDAGEGYSYLYTESWEFAQELRKEFRHNASYYRGMRAFAWQFRVPKRIVGIIRMRFKKLTGAEAGNAFDPGGELHQANLKELV